MAGHNKWSQIKHKKAVTDSRRASAWTKVIREITVAAKAGGGDPDGNPRLRTAIDAAKAVNMPHSNIERAVKKGTGELEGASYDEVTYEGYGPAGTAFLVEGSTDNANRTVAEIRHAFNKHGGNLGASNSVAWMFDRKGQVIIPAEGHTDEEIMEAALESGASDFEKDGDVFIISTEPTEFHMVMDALRENGYSIQSSELAMIAQNLVKVEQADAGQVLKLIESLEELDDVSKVFSNLDFETIDLEEAGT